MNYGIGVQFRFGSRTEWGLHQYRATTTLDPLCGGATLRVLVVRSSRHPEGVQRGVRMSDPLGPVWHSVGTRYNNSPLSQGELRPIFLKSILVGSTLRI